MTLYGVPMSPVSDLLRPDQLGAFLALYVGPDQILPLTSFLGAIVGIVLICWRYVAALAGKIRQFFSRR